MASCGARGALVVPIQLPHYVRCVVYRSWSVPTERQLHVDIEILLNS